MQETNIIKKHNFDFNFTGKYDPLQLRQYVESLCKEKLIPQIELTLDKLNIPGRLIRIDELNVEVSDIKAGSIEIDLVPKVIEAFEQAWDEKIKSISFQDPSVSLLEELGYFLNHGYLPWYAQTLSKDEWYNKISHALRNSTEQQVAELKQVASTPSARERLVQLPGHFFDEIINAINPPGTSYREDIRADIRLLLSISPLEHKWRIEYLYKTYVADYTLDTQETRVQIFTIRLTDLLRNLKIPAKELKQINWKSEIVLNVIKQISKEEANQSRESFQQEKSLADKAEREQKTGKARDDSDVNEEIFINNAGLVIIAPYLNSFFTRLELTERNELKENNQALAILNFMVTGTDEPAEYELVLPKILCGVPVEQVFNTEFRIKEEIKSEAVDLLNSVIRNWKALKNTSVEGLREAFLKREGKLSFNNNEWLLIVEQKSYDVLLSQLPWQISFIYLPWMKYRLRVDWV